MKLSEVGERALIKLARELFKHGPGVKVGIGDDAAALELDGKYLVTTTDMLVGRAHFPPETKPEQMGRKAVAVNLSDLAAMGAKPLALMFSVGLPRELEVGFVKKIIRGMDLEARRHGAYVVGGDLDESDDVIIAGAALGICSRGELMTRAGAKPGELLGLTGWIGAGAAGLRLLLKGLPRAGFEALVRAQLEPRPRVREGLALAKLGVKAAIDITDGLASNLWQLARESKVKLVVDEARVPIHPLVKRFSKRFGVKLEELAWFGGEDFELLFSVKSKLWSKVERALQKLGTRVTAIGKVERGRGVFVQKQEKFEKLPDRGYEHFVGSSNI